VSQSVIYIKKVLSLTCVKHQREILWK